MAFADDVAAADRVVHSKLGGESVTYDPAGAGAPVQVTGLFSEQYTLAKGDADAGVETIGPAVFLLLEDLPEDPRDEDAEPTITIRSVNYRVIERLPDGMGGIVLALRKVT